MDETNTKVTVSSINEMNTFHQERIITISGDIDDISQAEAEISSKLRAAYENDIQAMAVSIFTFKPKKYLQNVLVRLIEDGLTGIDMCEH